MRGSYGRKRAGNRQRSIHDIRELKRKEQLLEQLSSANQLLAQQNHLLQRELKKYQTDLDKTRKSWTYRIGRAATFIPRLLRQALKGEKKTPDIKREKAPLTYSFKIEKGALQITHRLIGEQPTEETGVILLQNIFWGGRINVHMTVAETERDRILWIHEMTDIEFMLTGEYSAKGPATGVLCAYTNQTANHICVILFSNLEQVYKRFVHCKYDTTKVKLSRRKLAVRVKGYITTEKELDIDLGHGTLKIDANHQLDFSLNAEGKRKTEFEVHGKIGAASIASQETAINNPIQLSISVCGVPCTFSVGKNQKSKKPTKFYFLPFSSTVYQDRVLLIRKNVNQNFSLVVRQKEQEEKELSFRILESRFISAFLYYSGKLWRRLHRRKVNLYYEKESMKAEEGTYQLFEKVSKASKTANYYILDRRSEQWEQLSKNKHVVERYTLFYYWLLYTSDYFISTETSAHLNVLRGRNYYVRKALLERPFIFLQHGVTYLKRQGGGSAFVKGKEGEPLYIAVGSEKERDIVCEMLKLEPEQCMKTGLPIFDTITYGHINAASPDIVTIMFTWKPSEEHLLTHFEDSLYYKSVRQVYELLQSRLPAEKIRIVPHPKVQELLASTDMEPQIWKGTISEVLRETKLLITDYSSVCYNAFYQGAAVLFYQPDLEAYEKEVGKLIPKAEEYIGYRVFSLDKVEKLLDDGIKDGKIVLDFFRRKQDMEMYQTINEFNDGKNIDRIMEFLTEKGIV